LSFSLTLSFPNFSSNFYLPRFEWLQPSSYRIANL
jgi:hypothetical protein